MLNLIKALAGGWFKSLLNPLKTILNIAGKFYLIVLSTLKMLYKLLWVKSNKCNIKVL